MDASIKLSIGMVRRNHHAEFSQARVVNHKGDIPVFEAEARCILESAKWAVELGMSKVI